MKTRSKKIIMFGIAFIMLFSFTACGGTTVRFNSLEELQAAMPADFYYFALDSEIFGEAKEFSAMKNSLSTYDRNGNHFYRYSICWDVKNPDNSQEYRLNVIGTHYRQPQITGKNYRNTVTIHVINIDGYFYYFILQGKETVLNETVMEYFRNIIESAIETKYKP